MKRTCSKAWTRNLNSHSLHSASGGGRGAQGRPFDIHMTCSNKDRTTAIVVSFNNGAKHDEYKSVYRAQGITTTGRGRGRGREEESRALHSPPPLMVSSLGLSSSFSSSSSTFNNPITQHRKKLFLVPCLSTRRNFSSNSDQEKKNPNLPNSDKKSLSVATGELFLGIASRIIKRTSANSERREFYFPRRNNNRVATVLDSSIDAAAAEEVLWDRRMKDFGDFELEDHTNNGGTVAATGFSFSAAGLLFPYHLGVAQYLIEKGYINETTPLAGSSAGAIVCAVVASGSSMQEALDATKILAEDCRLKGTAFRLGSVLRDVLVKFLPDDVHTRSNGRVRVAVTQILWRPRGLLVDQFDSKEDLINAVFTSSFIPGYLAPRPATLFRNRLCVDGGLTLFMPPTSATKTVRICAFPTERLGLQDVGISPDCNPDNRATPRQLFKWALEPADDHVLDRLFEVGYLDAAVWAERNLVEEIVADDRNIASP